MRKYLLWFLAALMMTACGLSGGAVFGGIYISDASATIRVAYADTGMPTAETLAKEISRLNQ